MTDVPDMQPLITGEVVAVGSAVNSFVPGLGEMIERAMVDAINGCYARGVTDDESILKAKMEAMDKTLLAFNDIVAAQSAD